MYTINAIVNKLDDIAEGAIYTMLGIAVAIIVGHTVWSVIGNIFF